MRLPTYRGSNGTTINMTPMIDVTFLLIIFFLVSSHLAKQDHNVALELPIAQSGFSNDIDREANTVTVHVMPDGIYRLGSSASDLKAITKLLDSKHRNTPGGIRLRIRTDRKIPYERVSPLLRACANSGIRNIVFAVYEEKPAIQKP